jgi:hypothetical protein
MKSTELSAILEIGSDKRQEAINDICSVVAKKVQRHASAEEALDALSEHLKEKYHVSGMTLEELNVYKSAIESLIESLSNGAKFGADEFNATQFFGALDYIVNEKINEKILEQCKKICNDYLNSLDKDTHRTFKDTECSASGFQKLTKHKYKIVKEAVEKLNDPNQELSFENKIASFQKVLTNPENAKILAKNRNSFAKEAAMQIGSLFLVNLYRMIAGTKGANLINILGIQNKQMSLKERLFGLKHQAQAAKEEKSYQRASGKGHTM